MNEKPADSAGASAANARCTGLPGTTADDDLPLSLSDNHKFIAAAQAGNIRDGSDPGSHLADITFRVVHGHDLRAISKDTQIQAFYLKQPAHGNATHDPYSLQLTRQDDGSYLGTMPFKRGGKFDFTIQLTDGGDQDGYKTNKITLQIQ